MSNTGRCPYCGASVRSAAGPDITSQSARTGQPGTSERGLEPLYREVRRIRELAEAHTADGDARRIAELTREVEELRATVARLRGPGQVSFAAPAEGAAGRRAG